MEVKFLTAIIGSLLAQYAAQDFEALPEGPPMVPFNYSEQSGDVFLAYDMLIDPVVAFNAGMEDMEIYPDGTIEKLDKSVSQGQVILAVGFTYPTPTLNA